jgi:hypothetical protein
MNHKIQWENYMTADEYASLQYGTTLHIKDSGSYMKVGGWGYYDSLLLNTETFKLHSPDAIITFRDYL